MAPLATAGQQNIRKIVASKSSCSGCVGLSKQYETRLFELMTWIQFFEIFGKYEFHCRLYYNTIAMFNQIISNIKYFAFCELTLSIIIDNELVTIEIRFRHHQLLWLKENYSNVQKIVEHE